MSILVLPVKREYFEAIKCGEKTEEYRLVNPYWNKRIGGRNYDKVIITLGYPKKSDSSRRLVFPWRGYEVKTITHKYFGNAPAEVYVIKLEK